MSIEFYMDMHVPYAITTALRLRGVGVLTAQDDGATEMEDSDLLDRATSLGRVVFTQDGDFLREASFRQHIGKEFAGVIYVHQLDSTIGQCVEELEIIAKACEPEDFLNRVWYLPLK